MSSTAEADAEDVNDFLRRIQELGTKRDQEDEERNRKLEEEILQGRKERQARRAERARSISPTKDSPVGTPNAAERFRTSTRATLSPAPDLQPSRQSPIRGDDTDAALEPLTSGNTAMKENSVPLGGSNYEHSEMELQRTSSIKPSPSNAMPTSRNSPLSWQRRPTSQASDLPRSRPLSMIATENASRSPRATPEPSTPLDDHTSVSRDQISQMLGAKDPTWFRQTAERGENSPAYRKNQVEDNNVVDLVSTSRMQLPGMSRGSSPLPEKVDSSSLDMRRRSPPLKSSSSDFTVGRNSFIGATSTSVGIGSPLPLTNAQRLEPPTKSYPDENTSGSGRAPAMSPSQGRISPERVERPASPTKGMGGFVQSAMMKRSDSVSKRWSVQSPPGLSRGNSVASNRSSVDPNASRNIGGLSKDNSPAPLSRPTSSHSNTTVVQDSGRPGTSSSMRSYATVPTSNEGFIKPLLPASRTLDTREGEIDSSKSGREETTPPSSPSKSTDTRRWSPTKSSWLESALSKPDSPKPKIAPPPLQQPAWMSEIAKAKQKGSTDSTKSLPMHKHEVNIGGLLRSPPLGGPTKPLGVGGLSGGVAPTLAKTGSSPTTGKENDSKVQTSMLSSKTSHRLNTEEPGLEKSTAANATAASIKAKNTPTPSSKVKPETPPKKDFRSNLKPRQLLSDEDKKDQPEFKNVFGQLRRTKTQNYVAPDELKDNILRGKAGLSVTGGPKKTERKDEFKEAILKKKEDFKKAQLEGTGVTRSTSNGSQKVSPLPEALAKKAALGRSGTVATQKQGTLDDPGLSHSRTPSKQSGSSPPKEVSAPSRTEGIRKDSGGGKLADRFNPALATLLARGPPSTASDTSRTSSPVTSQRGPSMSSVTTDAEGHNSAPQLTHMTKARARGPRRKAPSASTTNHPQNPIDMATQETPPLDRPEIATRQSNLSLVAAETPPATQSSTFVEPRIESPQPTSPRKLDIKRRSKFLEEVQNKFEKTPQQPDVSEPVQYSTKLGVVESPLLKQAPESPLVGRKVTPDAKPKPASLSTPVIRGGHNLGTDSAVKPLDKSEHTQPPTTSKPLNLQSPPSSIDVRDQRSAPETVVNTDSVISVKNSAALFSRQIAVDKSHEPPARAKEPIKLPARDDEDAAMVKADLRSIDSSTTSGVKLIGLGLRGTKVSSNNDEMNWGSIVSSPSQQAKDTTPAVGRSAKPAPFLSPNPPMSPSPNAGLKPSSPRKIKLQAVPQSSEASKLLIDFFGKREFVPDFDTDTAAILSMKKESPSKIKTLRSQLFQLTGDGKKQQVPTHQERILFENNMYLCPHIFENILRKRVVQVYFWAGDGVAESSIDDAELFALKEAKVAGGGLIRVRQGQEPSEFIEALGGIMITRRGSSNKYDSLAPHILCGRQYASQIVFDEVDFSPSSLCSGFPYLISTQSGKSYLWKGKGSGIDELSCARLVGMDFGVTGDVEEVEEGHEPASFLKVFGTDVKIMKSADHWRLKPNYYKYSARLFLADAASPSQIIEVAPFTQSSLSPAHIYILDAFFEIYIIVGAGSQAQYASFCTALLFAQEYGILAAGMEDRPFVPVSTVVLEGVPRDLKFVFRKWRDAAAPTVLRTPATPGGLSRGRSLRVVPLSAALDATRF